MHGAGELSSDDDFYMLDSGLVVLQTTNDIHNTSLYDLLDYRSVVSWQRVSSEFTECSPKAEIASNLTLGTHFYGFYVVSVGICPAARKRCSPTL